MEERLARLREAMERRGLEAVWITGEKNRYYLSGFRSSAGALLITRDRSCLITDFRYVEAARQGAPGFEVHRHGQGPEEDMLAVALRILEEESVHNVAFEEGQLSWAAGEELRRRWHGLEVVPGGGLVEELRRLKDPAEVEAVATACRIAEEALEEVLPELKPGVRESDFALALEWAMRKRGAEAAAFEFIVASGPRGALPHGYASERRVQAGELVTIDFGASWRGYASDVTRTVAVGHVDEEQRRVYEIVRQAQQAGLEALRPGATGGEVDAAARERIAREGFGAAFGHSLGHGVGLDVHEAPRLAAGSEERLEPGMVVTVEPGIYRPGWGGVRIEDTVLVTADGYRNLCSSSKELRVL
ncbi:MAG: Xaa-Pro peptidase family protein [Firmicutes bacterium]|nr:Xaa-Pro peptidase family protein [Bacillota bacterium]